MRRRPLHLLLALVPIAAGCGIQTDSAPRDVPADERTIIVSGVRAGADAAGADRIYLVGPGEGRLLRSVPRETVPGLSLIEILLLGPNENEIASQYSTVIPSGTRLRSSSAQGSFLFVDLSDDITELTGASLAQAVAQVVFTATELEGIEAVQLTVNDEDVAWPTGDGGTTTGPLRTYDYPGFVQTAQPAYPAVPVAAST